MPFELGGLEASSSFMEGAIGKPTEGNGTVTTYLERSSLLRQRLLDLDVALHQLRGGSYRQCQDAVGLLGDLCNFFATESQQGFQEEEVRLYALAFSKQPQLRGLLKELCEEHGVLRLRVEEFRRGLVQFNTTGDLHDLPDVGRTLLHLLRRHLEREAHELIPQVHVNLDSSSHSGEAYGEADYQASGCEVELRKRGAAPCAPARSASPERDSGEKA